MRSLVLLLGMFMGGCSLVQPSDPPPLAEARPGLDPHCARAARDRVTDAAENGVEKTDQDLIYRDAYRHCVESPATFQSAD